jgi:hypothetical protein
MARRNPVLEVNKRLKTFRHAIGDYVVAFGNLESDIDDAIVRLLLVGDEHRAKVAISQILNVSTRIRLLAVLAGLLTKRRRPVSKVEKIAVQLSTQNAFRNNLIHGAFNEFATYRVPNKRTIQHEWRKTKINPHSMKVATFNATFSELKKNTRMVEELGLKLQNAVHELILNGLKDLTRKPPPSRTIRAQRRLKRLLGQDQKTKAL